ncbi:hypothetical protein CAMGR0001_0673 [Campylobacter gracilis RM3268]|uniref:Uncharacterized protein n=1 Tax=Campylobacter gracilis RM3268 TaxID=553220 RepID=C8PFN0_9BACT|nr:hypothetical protein CAMGR0001_0673 [Campylobacter gracilis RM3268]
MINFKSDVIIAKSYNRALKCFASGFLDKWARSAVAILRHIAV